MQYYTLLWKPRFSLYPFLISSFPPSGFQMASASTKLLIKHFWEREYKSSVKIWCLLFLCVAAQWSGRISRTVTPCLETSKPEGTICTTKFNIKNFYVLLRHSIRDADKSLARSGRKQARKHVRGARDFNNIEMRTVIKLFFLQGKAPKEIHANLTQTLAYFLPGRAKDLSAPLYLSDLYG